MKKRYILASALAAAAASPFPGLSGCGTEASSRADELQTEKCYGIAKAGKNDCASAGSHSCGGTSQINGDPKSWIFVPEGYCERIVGGSKTPK